MAIAQDAKTRNIYEAGTCPLLPMIVVPSHAVAIIPLGASSFHTLIPGLGLAPWLLLAVTFAGLWTVRVVQSRRIRLLESRERELADLLAQRTMELPRAREEAVPASHSRSEMLAQISHQIRAPLSGVVGMIEYVLDGDLTTQQRQRLESSKLSFAELQALVDSLVDSSKDDKGSHAFESILESGPRTDLQGALEGPDAASESQPPSPSANGSGEPPDSASGRCLEILLAEDNLINQKVAVRILEKARHAVTVVGNGKEAIAALVDHAFDLVLMDIQMPEMDGFEALAAIREEEKSRGGHLPIIAMTAYALKGDRERCLESGFDGFVPKPIRSQELLRTIVRLDSSVNGGRVSRAGVRVSESSPNEVARGSSDEWPADHQKDRDRMGSPDRDGEGRIAPDLVASSSSTFDPTSNDVFDKSSSLDRFDGDESFLRELAGLFLADCPRCMSEIRVAVGRGDTWGLKSGAHTLKGAIGNFHAPRAFAAAQRLEAMGHAGNLREADAAFEGLVQAIGDLQEAFADLG